MPTQTELREQITQQIIDALKNGGLPPWRRPWRSTDPGFPVNVQSRRPYRGLNVCLLDMAASRYGFRSRYWGTFNQWKKLGGRVMRRPDDVEPGRWGTTVVFWAPIVKTEIDMNGDEVEIDRFFIQKQYTVFCLDQVEGSQFDHLRASEPDTSSAPAPEIYEKAEEAIAATKADLRFGGDRAFYSVEGDYIQCPIRETFTEADEFYETLFHELCHWSEPRLGWQRDGKDRTYALYELVAEMGSAFISRSLGIPNSANLTNHAAYLQSWLMHMENDSRFIFIASGMASKAADFVLSFSRKEEPKPEEEGVLVA